MSSKWAAVFDLDGVIIDSRAAQHEAVVKWCHRYDVRVSDELLEIKVFGKQTRQWIPELLGRNVQPEELQHLSDEKERLFWEIYKDKVQLIHGLSSLLTELKQAGIPMAVATSAPRSSLERILWQTRLEKFFSVLLYENSVSRGKPFPEIYLRTAEMLHLPAKACIVFEDSPAGIEAARQAGCIVIGVMTNCSTQDFSQVELVIRDFTELNLVKLSAIAHNK